jgi:site-specific DNA recombinase
MELPAGQDKRAAIYTRISLDPNKKDDDEDTPEPIRRGGDGLGVQRQEEDCRELADRLGWQVIEVFEDNDISAYSGKTRPGFEALLDAMKTGQVDAIICWHTDRLYRSMKDLERLIEIAEAGLISIKTVNAGDLDLGTSAGRMMARILGSVSRQESEHKGERQKRANLQKAESGVWQTANRTFGYGARVRCRDAKCDCDGYHDVGIPGEPLEPEATAYRQAVSDVLAGKSIQGVAREWNAKGLKTTLAGRKQKRHGKEYTVSGEWNAPRVRRLMVNPRYAGLKTLNGKVVGQGKWSPLIDVETHEGLVAYLSDPSRVKCTSFERKYIGSGVYLCGVCGGPMKASQPGGRKERSYVCRQGSHVLRAGEPLDAFVTATVLEKLAEPNAHLLLDNPEVDLADLQDKRAALRAKLDDYTQMFNEDIIDGPQFRKGTADLRAKLSTIDAQLAAAVRTSPVAALVADQQNIWQRWQNMSPAVRGQVVDELVVVRVLPCKVKGRGFDHDCVDVKFRQGME